MTLPNQHDIQNGMPNQSQINIGIRKKMPDGEEPDGWIFFNSSTVQLLLNRLSADKRQFLQEKLDILACSIQLFHSESRHVFASKNPVQSK